MGCMWAVAMCAGGLWEYTIFDALDYEAIPCEEQFGYLMFSMGDSLSVAKMQMISSIDQSLDPSCPVIDGFASSSCAFPINGHPTFEEGALNVCCHAGICSVAFITPGTVGDLFGNMFTQFVSEFESDVNLCELETCLSEGDRCEDIEQIICQDGYTNEWLDDTRANEYCNYRPTESPSKFPTKSPSKFPTKFPTKSPSKLPTKFPTKSPTKFPSKSPNYKTRAPSSDNNSDDDSSDIFAAGSVQSHLAKTFGIDSSYISGLRAKHSDGHGQTDLDRIVSINGKPMTLREYISNYGQLSDKMKHLLATKSGKRYENIQNDNAKQVNDDINILNKHKQIQPNDETNHAKTVKISFTHYVFLSMFAIFGIISLSIANIFYWWGKKNKI